MNTVKVFFRTILRLIIRFLRQQTYKNFRTIKQKNKSFARLPYNFKRNILLFSDYCAPTDDD